jgi:hypothetical protein
LSYYSNVQFCGNTAFQSYQIYGDNNVISNIFIPQNQFQIDWTTATTSSPPFIISQDFQSNPWIGTTGTGNISIGPISFGPETEEQKKAREELEAQRFKAKERGQALLKELLSDSEYAALYKEGIWVESKLHKDRKYLVTPSDIRVYEQGNDVGWLCIHTVDPGYIDEDLILTRLMMAETNEEELLKVAIMHPAL